MTEPNFLIIGAAKAGTTAIYNYLNQHPDIYMSPVKEPMFFAFEDEKPNFCGPRSETINQSIADLASYQSLFKNMGNAIAVGEASPIYLYSKKAPARIAHHLPNVKLIAILRNPVERAYSHYLMLVRNGVEQSNSFSEALNQEESRIQKHQLPAIPYLQGGFYNTQLIRYYERFHPSQIRVYLYEDLTQNSPGLFNDVFSFLGVNPTFVPDTSVKHNVSGVPRNRFLNNLINQSNPFKLITQIMLPKEIRKRITGSIQNYNLAKPSMPLEARNYLKTIYQSEIEQLQSLIDRDLSHWLN